MIEIGKMQKLQVMSITVLGAYLNFPVVQDGEDILLPKRGLPEGLAVGDELEVFVNSNAEGVIIATLEKPKLTIGELGCLQVADITNFGAFLDWGLPKDLLLPIKEQVGRVKIGDLCLVGLYVNQSNKICATMRIYDLLSSEAPYKKNDLVQGIVYRINRDLGVFVAVDGKYHGFIHNNEMFGNFTAGDVITARVKKVREDGKLELSLRQMAYKEIEGDAEKIMERLKVNGGSLPFNDYSDPEHIKAELNMSKRAFKRAVGRLLKEGAIKTTEEGIELMW
ncbi:hypothetical protein SPSYN_02178 [Sporotomaculum syntrophicum]|uniref:S1 motif domain-containing protein n=1 Tax=Sporotomaculum syntrophicum TaxID=182264 RepID=A0A9D3AXG0_9FIRM|nr:S1-like domain-containing RNA-binding protein [Sporotomaculum syntrophicum]KAF1084401.1 hypothetical protein SPSYN_02178 [Sporotomaculum syntrophicum]